MAAAMRMGTDRVVGLIYECAFDMAQWPSLLSAIEDVLPGSIAVLWLPGRDGRRLAVFSPMHRDREADALLDAETAQISRLPVPLPFRQVELVAGDKGTYMRPSMPPEVLALDSAGLCAVPVEARLLIVGPYGPPAADTEEVLSGLSPHFASSMALGRQMMESRQRTQILGDVLDRLPFGTLVLDGRGRMIAANRAAQAHFARWPEFVVDSFGHWRARKAEVQQTLAAVIEDAADHRNGSRMRVVKVVEEGGRTVSVLVAPLRERSAGAVLAFIADSRPNVPDVAAALGELYGLSKVEALIVQDLLKGRRLDQVAEKNKTSVHTVRVQLKSIFAKTGTRRQADLVNMILAGPAAFSPTPT